ncbi:MAG: putative metal-dependent phosphoesterase (PHP family) [Ktedonobacterales bacterium]|nr:MAG: putative metal-dependent phosphoesterase (PHP family) [Ktedonobacterales bacterium]
MWKFDRAAERHSHSPADEPESTLLAEHLPASTARGHRGLADVHMHTNYSDGTGSVEEVLDFAQRFTRLDVLAITDHDTIEGALRARDLAAQRGYRFEVIVGEEISTREGHLLALFLQTPVAPDQSIERSIEQVHAQGGLAIVAHPFNRVFRHSVQRSVMNRLLRQPEVHPDGIETLNGSFAGIGSSRIAMTLARNVYHWAETGGSDAHTPTAVGCARTAFAGRTADDLRAALLRRETLPLGTYWHAREYVAFVSHRMRYGGGATSELEVTEVRGNLLAGWSARRAAQRMSRSA